VSKGPIASTVYAGVIARNDTMSSIYNFFNIFYLPFAWCLSEALRNHLLGGFSFYISHAHAFCP